MIDFELVQKILDELGIEYAYYQFSEPITADRYIAYFENAKDRFLADNKVYAFESRFSIELYTKAVEPDTEQKLIDLFDKYEVAWSADSATYIDTERVYMTVFYI